MKRRCRLNWTGTGKIKDKNEDFEHFEFCLKLVEIERELVYNPPFCFTAGLCIQYDYFLMRILK